MVCYDIASPKRLRKTAKVLENFGIRVQYSFFQCDSPSEKMQELKEKVFRIIDKKKDSFFIYPLCADCSKKAIVDGKGEIIKLKSFEII